MKPRQYDIRSDEERAAFEWWLVRRPPKWSVALHVIRFGGDDRDADLMLELVDLRSIGAYRDVRGLQLMAGQDGYVFYGWMGHYSWIGRPYRDESGFDITHFA